MPSCPWEPLPAEGSENRQSNVNSSAPTANAADGCDVGALHAEPASQQSAAGGLQNGDLHFPSPQNEPCALGTRVVALGAARILGIGEHALEAAAIADGVGKQPGAIRIKSDARLREVSRKLGDAWSLED